MTKALKLSRAHLLVCGLVVALPLLPWLAQPNPDASEASLPQSLQDEDGQNDFDFEIGTWATHLSLLKDPLTGSDEWVEYEGTTVVRKVWDGRANLVELEVEGPAGRIEGLSLRLYDPEAGQWSLNFSNSRIGTLSPPVIGDFEDGRGEFYGQEIIGGRPIYVRFVISDITPNSVHFEQAFSDDGGRTWEVNWIATDTRVDEEGGRGEAHGAVPDQDRPAGVE